jgi:hypothetical protein
LSKEARGQYCRIAAGEGRKCLERQRTAASGLTPPPQRPPRRRRPRRQAALTISAGAKYQRVRARTSAPPRPGTSAIDPGSKGGQTVQSLCLPAAPRDRPRRRSAGAAAMPSMVHPTIFPPRVGRHEQRDQASISGRICGPDLCLSTSSRHRATTRRSHGLSPGPTWPRRVEPPYVNGSMWRRFKRNCEA